MPVKPFKLVPGCYVETENGDLLGPVFQFDSDRYGVHNSPVWNLNGVPLRTGRGFPRIKTVITGPVGLNAYIDRATQVAGDERLLRSVDLARQALAEMRVAATHDSQPPAIAIEAEPVGEAAERALDRLLRTIIREEVSAVIREELPAIVAEAANPFAGSDLRLVLSVSALRD